MATESTVAAVETNAPLLILSGVGSGYGRKQVVYDIDLQVHRGEIVTLMGHNGAGKSTLLRSVLGMLPVMTGTIHYDGHDITHAKSRRRVAAGIGLVPSERFVFPDLTVRENLLLGIGSAKDKQERLTYVHDLFPILSEREKQFAGTLSGGQQRMLSLGVLLSSHPRLLMLDEPSLGLGPSIVQQIFEVVRHLADEHKMAVLLVEQNVPASLRVTDRVLGIRAGRMFLEEDVEVTRRRGEYWDLF